MILACLLLSTLPLTAQDEVLAQGKVKIELTYSSVGGDRYFTFLEDETAINVNDADQEYEREKTTLTYSYGWRKDVTVVVMTENTDHNITQSVSNSGISGYYVGIRQRLGRPIGGNRLTVETGVRQNEPNGDNLPLSGDGLDVYLVGSYGQQFRRGSGIAMNLGYILRDDPADEIFVDVRTWVDLGKLVRVELNYHTLESQEEQKTAYDFFTYAPERGIQSYGLKLSRNISKSWGLALGWKDDFAGRNDFAVDGYSLTMTWAP